MTETLFGDGPAPRERRAGIGSHHSHTSITDEWLTPRWLVERLAGTRRGQFYLDPCAAVDRPWDTARRHLTVEDNGLTAPWPDSTVWLNPPYSQAERWMRRMAAHDRGTALVFARTETAWWHESVWPHAVGVLFLRGRVRFCEPDGTPGKYTAGGPSALIAYGAGELDRLTFLADLGKLVRL